MSDSGETVVLADFALGSRRRDVDVRDGYAYLYRHSTGREEGGLEIRSLIKTKTPKMVFHRYEPRNKGYFPRLFAVVRAYLDDLDAGRFVFRPCLGCAMCDYRDDHCRSWEA